MESVLGRLLIVSLMLRNHECNLTNGHHKLELCKKDCFRNYLHDSQGKENVKTIDIQTQCSEKCSRYALGYKAKNRQRKSINKENADRVLKVARCKEILSNKNNDTAENLGKPSNISVKYSNDSAFVTWEPRNDIPMNKSWLGYVLYWFTYEGPPPWKPVCKIYPKNQTIGVIRDGFGWNSSYDLHIDVLLFPSKNPTVRYDSYPRPVATMVPLEVVESQTEDLKLYVSLGGGIGGILFVTIFGVLFCCRNREKSPVDVFITYSRKNEKFVLEELLPLLDIYRINFTIDFIDFEPGVPWMDNLMECICNSSKILIVMSSHYLASMNCKKELQQALYNKGTSSIILLRIDSVSVNEFPKALRNRTFIDYADSVLERHTWKSRVIKALERNNEIYSRSVSLESKEDNTKKDQQSIL